MRTPDIATGAVNSRKVADSAVLGVDLRDEGGDGSIAFPVARVTAVTLSGR